MLLNVKIKIKISLDCISYSVITIFGLDYKLRLKRQRATFELHLKITLSKLKQQL